MSSVEVFALFEHAKIQPCLHFQGIVKPQCTPYVVAEASHGLRLLLVALARASTDRPASNLMAILLKLPLDVVCIIESCFAVWRTLGRVMHSLDTMTNMLFEVMRNLVEETRDALRAELKYGVRTFISERL